MQTYANKPQGYFANARTEIAPLLPKHVERVLEVGCGAGATLRWLRDNNRCNVTVGLELFEDAALVARQNIDQVICGNAEALLDAEFEPNSFDLVLCLDVLEHMIDPWAFVTKVEKILKPGGLLISSIPNVRNIRVVASLVVCGRWTYQSEGILDRTHLRFFTKESALSLVKADSLQVVALQRNMVSVKSKAGLLNLLTLGLFRDFFTTQYLIAAQKKASCTQQSHGLTTAESD